MVGALRYAVDGLHGITLNGKILGYVNLEAAELLGFGLALLILAASTVRRSWRHRIDPHVD